MKDDGLRETKIQSFKEANGKLRSKKGKNTTVEYL